MAQLNYTADVNDLESDFKALPAGEYKVIIEDSSMEATKNGRGQYLKLTYQIIEGPKQGSKLFENINLVNDSQQAVEIGKKALNSICVALGLGNVADSAMLHNQPLILDVKCKGKEDDEYGIQNVIKKHLPINGQAPTSQNQNSAPAQQQQGSENSNVPVWAK